MGDHRNLATFSYFSFTIPYINISIFFLKEEKNKAIRFN